METIRIQLLAVPLTALALLLPSPATAATHTVTNLADSGPGSLRQTIATASASDFITFATNGTITLTSGELLIEKNLNIIGPGTIRTLIVNPPTGNKFYRLHKP